MRIINIVYAAAILFITACNGERGERKSINSLGTKFENLVIKDIPEDKKGEPCYMYKRCQEASRQLELDSLTNGFDSLKIRLWFFAGMTSEIQVLDISYLNNNWEAVLINQLNKPHYDSKTKIRSETVSPQSSWANYVNQILKRRIIDLPNEDSIEGWESGGGDIGIICVEVAGVNFYRFYSYLDYPKPVELSQYVSFSEIIRITEDEFGFSRVSKIHE